MQSSTLICPECGGENRPGTARCVHCALLFDEKRKPLTDFRQLKEDLEDMRVANEAAALREQKADERREAADLRGKVLPQDEEADVIQMEGLPFPWQRYLAYAAALLLIIFLGGFAYKVMFPKPEVYGTLHNHTERAGSPLYKQVLAVSSKADYGRAQESLLENSEMFDTLMQNGSIKLMNNGTSVKIVERSNPYSLIECEGQQWYVLSDYVSAGSSSMEGEPGNEEQQADIESWE